MCLRSSCSPDWELSPLFELHCLLSLEAKGSFHRFSDVNHYFSEWTSGSIICYCAALNCWFFGCFEWSRGKLRVCRGWPFVFGCCDVGTTIWWSWNGGFPRGGGYSGLGNSWFDGGLGGWNVTYGIATYLNNKINWRSIDSISHQSSKIVIRSRRKASILRWRWLTVMTFTLLGGCS